MPYIIVRNKRPDIFGKTRSEHEKNLRKEWGSTMSDEQLDKLKFIERKIRDKYGSKKNLITGPQIDQIR